MSIQRVQVNIEKFRRKKTGSVGVCKVCHEAYPLRDGDSCRSCQGETPYKSVLPMTDTVK